MSHPSLGLPPLDLSAGSPAAAERLRLSRSRLATRALEVALDSVKGMRERYDEDGLRQLLRDTELIVDRVAVCVAAGDPLPAREYGEQTAPLYRRRKVPMDDLIALSEGLRAALPSVLAPGEMPAAEAALDAANDAWRWHRRIAGDGRRKNAFLQFLYKGG